MDATTRRGFLNLAALFEGGTLLAALALGWATGVLAETPISLNGPDLLWGFVAIPPMFIGLRYTTGIRRQVVDVIGKSLSLCRWYDLAALALLAGLGEELLFRGVLQPWAARWDPWVAFIGVNLLFGMAHAMTPGYFLFATVVGMYFSWLTAGFPIAPRALATPNLLRPIIAHAGYDFVAFFLIIRDYRRDVAAQGDPGDD